MSLCLFVMGGATLSTENADLASSSWSCFCFTPVRTTESSSCCMELSSFTWNESKTVTFNLIELFLVHCELHA